MNQTIIDGMPYGGRSQIQRYPFRPVYLDLEIHSGLGSLTHSKFTVQDKNQAYLILMGRMGALAPFTPELTLKSVPRGKELGIHFFHAVPEDVQLDIYFNRIKVGENFHYGDMDDLDFKDAIREITLVPHGKTPAFDPTQDELHYILSEHLIPTRALLVFGLKPGQITPGVNKETVFIYPN
jgi:hypothetical protein